MPITVWESCCLGRNDCMGSHYSRESHVTMTPYRPIIKCMHGVEVYFVYKSLLAIYRLEL